MIVVDTHVWVWMVQGPERLSAAALAAIDSADRIGVSAMSCWEVGMLCSRGRLVPDRPPAEWIRAALHLSHIVALDLTPAIAFAAGSLEGYHGDPADRIIAATALHHHAPLVTRDQRLRASPITTIW